MRYRDPIQKRSNELSLGEVFEAGHSDTLMAFVPVKPLGIFTRKPKVQLCYVVETAEGFALQMLNGKRVQVIQSRAGLVLKPLVRVVGRLKVGWWQAWLGKKFSPTELFYGLK